MEQSKLEDLKSKLREEFSDYYEIAGGKNYRYRHLETTRKLALKLAEKLDAEVDEGNLEIAALFHDIGRAEDIEDGVMDPFEGHEGHAERGAEKVESFISEHVTDEELEKIQELIRNHHSEAEYVEGKILQDADRLSNFGVNNLWRQIHYASQHNLEMQESIEYFWNEGIKQYRDQIKNMYFKLTKDVAEKRLERQKKVFRDIEKEMDAEDF